MQSKIKIFFIGLCLYCISSIGFVSTAYEKPPGPVEQNSDLGRWAQQIISILMILIVLGAVLTIIISAYRYMAAAGNPEEIKKSKEGIIIAVSTVVLMFLAWGILSYIAPQIFPHFNFLRLPFQSPF